MPSLALELTQLDVTGVEPGPSDYARRRPFLTRGTLRRIRHVPPGGELLVQPGDQVDAATPIARARRAGRAAAIDLAGALGVSPDRDDGLPRHLVRTAGEEVAEGEVLAERRALGGLQRRSVRAPLTGTLLHVSPETGAAYLAPAPVEVDVHAHLAGRVVAVHQGAVTIEGTALAVAARAGAGPAVTGTLLVAGSPETVPQEAAGAIVACAFAVDAAVVGRLVDTGAVAIVAAAIEEDALERLGWDAAFWPERRTARTPAPPVTVLALSFSSTPPAGLWEALTALAGRPASAVGSEPGAAPELLVSLGANAPSLYGLPESGEADVTLAPGARVRVIAGRGEGLVGEIVALSPGPYRLRSEVAADVADVVFPYDVRLRVPVTHLQAMPPLAH